MTLFDLLVSVGVDDQASSGIQSISAQSVALGNVMSQVFVGAANMLGGFAKSAIQTGMSFDTAMSQVAATMGLTDDQIDEVGGSFDRLRQKALEMGSSTKFTATEAAAGLNILAMAGLNANESMEGINIVLDLAAAGAMDLESSASYVTAAVKGFGDSMENAGYYADLMSKGATLANTSVAQLGEAFAAGSATASTFNQNAESMTVALLRLAEQNITGSTAATALNRAMMDLYTPTDDAAKALKELGVATYDEAGNARDFNEVVADLQESLSGYNQEQANAYAATIFTSRGLQAYNKLTVTSAEKVDAFADSLGNAFGSTAAQAATQIDNLQGDITIMNSAMDGLKISISDGLTPAFRKLVQTGTSSIQNLTQNVTSNGEKISDSIIKIVDFVSENSDTIITVIGGIGAAMVTTQLPLGSLVVGFQNAAVQMSLLAMNATSAEIAEMALNGTLSAQEIIVGILTGKITLQAAAQAALNAVTLAFPAIALAAGVGAITAAVIASSKAAKKLREEIERLSKEKVIGDDESASVEEMTKNLEEMQSELEAVLEKKKEVEAYTPWDAEEYQKQADILTQAIEQQQQAIDDAVASETSALASAASEAGLTTELFLADLGSIQGSIESLTKAYADVYNAAYDSITGQFGLFEEFNAKDLVKTSVDDMITALNSQTEYMQTYAENIKILAEAGINDGLLATLSDGSTESAGYVQSIVDSIQSASDGGAELLSNLNSAYEANQEAAAGYSSTVAETVTNYSEQMETLVSQTVDAVAGLDQNAEAYAAVKATIDGAVDAATTEGTALNSALVSVAQSALASFYAALGAPGDGTSYHSGSGHASVSASGIDYVPTNGFLTYLHKGESVLTRSEADDYRAGKSGNGSTVNIYAQSIDEATVDYILQRVNAGLVGA